MSIWVLRIFDPVSVLSFWMFLPLVDSLVVASDCLFHKVDLHRAENSFLIYYDDISCTSSILYGHFVLLMSLSYWYLPIDLWPFFTRSTTAAHSLKASSPTIKISCLLDIFASLSRIIAVLLSDLHELSFSLRPAHVQFYFQMGHYVLPILSTTTPISLLKEAGEWYLPAAKAEK